MKTPKLRVPAWYLVSGAIILALGTVPPLLREANTDDAWLIYLSERVLEGQRQGIDFFEVNPPLSIWMMIPATLLSHVTGVSSWQIWVLLTVAICLGAVALTSRLLRSVVSDRGRSLQLAMVAGFAFLVLPRLEFSEREHLALVLTLPFVILTAARATGAEVGHGSAISSGLLGGIGFSLKPHFLAAWLLLELFLLNRLRLRSLLRPELATLAGFGILYVVLVLTLVPDYLPMAFRLAPVYATYLDNGFLGATRMAGPYLLFTGGVALALRFAVPRRDTMREVITLAFLGFLLSAILQRKGFAYHYLPAWGLGLLLLSRGWQTRPAELSWRPSGVVLRLGFILLLLAPLYSLADATRELIDRNHRRYRLDPQYSDLLPRVRELAAGGTIAVFSSNPTPAWPLTLDAGARWAFRYMSHWPLTAIYDNQIWASPQRLIRPRPFASRTGFERQFSDEVVDDLVRHRPRLVVVLLPEQSAEGGVAVRRIDYLEYFGSDPRFRDFMRDYREVPRLGTYGLWLRAIP